VTGAELKESRLASAWTQFQAAQNLGVTQAYLSMVERGTRPVSEKLAARVVEVLDVPATSLPLESTQTVVRSELFFKEALGTLNYPGFAYLRGSARVNPAALLMYAIDTEDLDARVTESLPWIPLTYPSLNWAWLIMNAKALDRQNRLAYLVELARQIAGRKREAGLVTLLAKQIEILERSRLAMEDTLCEASLTQAERTWLRSHRSAAAEHWNLLTDLKVEHLDHAFL
jgi:transcriptional regulator with XRE-family HTH domain